MANYDDDATVAKLKLNKISPSMCMAKWLQVSLHLPQGRTHSCYHPPTHPIPLDELKANPNALHNTKFKLEERRQMMSGKRPKGCQYCWNVEDAPNSSGEVGEQLSDRHYRSSEWWVKDAWDEVVENAWDHDIAPRYVEVNFNQACNLKCAYCSPHLSTAWEDDIKQHGSFNFSDGGGHNNIQELKTIGLMPLEVARKDNPYITAFWEWFPNIYSNLKIFRMTGGEPLMDKNTFKVLDYIRDNPNPNLEVSLTTNMCPPDDALFDKFIEKIQGLEKPLIDENDPTVKEVDFKDLLFNKPEDNKRSVLFYAVDPKDGSKFDTWKQYIVEETLHGVDAWLIQPNIDIIKSEDIPQKFEGLGPCIDDQDNSFLYLNNYVKDPEWNKWNHLFENVTCKHISVFISVDGIGPQAEYIRDGLDWEKLMTNVDRLLTETTRVSVTFINTFNLLSIPSLGGFLDYILTLREKFGYDYQVEQKHKVLAQKIWFDVPYMRDPNWFNIQLADEDMLDVIQENIEYMKSKVLPDEEYGKSYNGFKNYEVLKLERDLAWAKEGGEMYEEELSNRLVRFYDYFNQYDKRRGFNFTETFPELVDFMREAKEEYEEKYAP